MRIVSVISILFLVGCIESDETGSAPMFQETELDAVLAISADFSGSFSELMDQRGHELFMNLMSQFVSEEIGSESRIVLGQISGGGETVLFEGKPADLRKKFGTPERLRDFLRGRTTPTSSRVLESTSDILDHVCNMHGVTSNTRILTVILSDCRDSEKDIARKEELTARATSSLERYEELGGCFAIYFCARSEIENWASVLQSCGFDQGRFIIEAEIAESPRLPEFY